LDFRLQIVDFRFYGKREDYLFLLFFYSEFTTRHSTIANRQSAIPRPE